MKLEDIYRPYKPKRRTRAMIARERGLEPLALYILSGQGKPAVPVEAEKYVDAEHEVPDVKAAIQGAEDIIAETMSDSAALRAWIRRKSVEEGCIVSAARTKQQAAEHSVYDNYYAYSEPIRKIPGHRVLALNRGEKEKILSIRLEVPEADQEFIAHVYKYAFVGLMLDWIKDGMKDDPGAIVDRLGVVVHGNIRAALERMNRAKK